MTRAAAQSNAAYGDVYRSQISLTVPFRLHFILTVFIPKHHNIKPDKCCFLIDFLRKICYTVYDDFIGRLNMNRSESKFQNTANKMSSALVSLLKSKEFADISIMDICNAAGVNRSTFYAHYDNTYDLLKETYQGLISNFLNECTFEDAPDITDMRNLDKDELNFISPKYLLPYLKYIEKHKQLYKIYTDNAHTFDTNEMDDYTLNNLFIPIYAKHGVTDKKLVGYMQKYFLKGIDAVITEWVRQDCEDDILFICEIITYCVRPWSYKKENLSS